MNSPPLRRRVADGLQQHGQRVADQRGRGRGLFRRRNASSHQDATAKARDNQGNTPIFSYVNDPKAYSGRDYDECASERLSNPEDIK